MFYFIEYDFFLLVTPPSPTLSKKKKKGWKQVAGIVSFAILEFLSFDLMGTAFDESSDEIGLV